MIAAVYTDMYAQYTKPAVQCPQCRRKYDAIVLKVYNINSPKDTLDTNTSMYVICVYVYT